MRSNGDLAGLIKFLARDDWKSSFEEVLGEHFGPAMQAFDLEYEAIGAALGGSWDMTLWGVAFEDFLGRQFDPDGRNFVDEYLRRRGWNESAPTKAYMRGLRNSIMSLYEASAIVSRQSFLARDLVRGGDPVLISERTATRTLKEWDRIAARIVVQGQKRILASGVLAFSFEGSERLMANLQEAAQLGIPPGVPVKAAKSIGPCPSYCRADCPGTQRPAHPPGACPGVPAAWLPAAAYGKYSLSETDVQGSANDANGAWAVAAVCRSERPLRVGLSRWLGSSAVDGFDEPRMAARGGLLTFAASHKVTGLPRK